MKKLSVVSAILFAFVLIFVGCESPVTDPPAPDPEILTLDGWNETYDKDLIEKEDYFVDKHLNIESFKLEARVNSNKTGLKTENIVEDKDYSVFTYDPEPGTELNKQFFIDRKIDPDAEGNYTLPVTISYQHPDFPGPEKKWSKIYTIIVQADGPDSFVIGAPSVLIKENWLAAGDPLDLSKYPIEVTKKGGDKYTLETKEQFEDLTFYYGEGDNAVEVEGEIVEDEETEGKFRFEANDPKADFTYKSGDHTVTLEYSEIKRTFDITVRTLESVEVTKDPVFERELWNDELFDLNDLNLVEAGLEVTAYYNNDASKPITTEAIELLKAKYDPLTTYLTKDAYKFVYEEGTDLVEGELVLDKVQNVKLNGLKISNREEIVFDWDEAQEVPDWEEYYAYSEDDNVRLLDVTAEYNKTANNGPVAYEIYDVTGFTPDSNDAQKLKVTVRYEDDVAGTKQSATADFEVTINKRIPKPIGIEIPEYREGTEYTKPKFAGGVTPTFDGEVFYIYDIKPDFTPVALANDAYTVTISEADEHKVGDVEVTVEYIKEIKDPTWKHTFNIEVSSLGEAPEVIAAPGAGNYYNDQQVTLSLKEGASEAATLEYSLDNGATWLAYDVKNPATLDVISSLTKIKVRSMQHWHSNFEKDFDYTLQVTDPVVTIDPDADTFTIAMPTEGEATNGATIYWGFNTNDPTTLYDGTAVNKLQGGLTTVKAIAKKDGYTDSKTVVSEPHFVQYDVALTPPTADPDLDPDAAGNYNNNLTVTLIPPSVPATGVKIYYTTDGSDPTEETGTEYTGAISVTPVDGTKTIKAITTHADYKNASVPFEATYNFKVADPVLSELALFGNTVTIETATNGDAIYYTIDGSDPTETSLLYNRPFTVPYNETTTVKAIAVKTGYANGVATPKDYAPQMVIDGLPSANGVYDADYFTNLDLTPPPGMEVFYKFNDAADFTEYVKGEVNINDLKAGPNNLTFKVNFMGADVFTSDLITFTVQAGIESVTANNPGAITDKLAITFDVPVAAGSLTADNVTITDGTGAATKGALTGDDTAWELAVTTTAQGNVSVGFINAENFVKTATTNVDVNFKVVAQPAVTGIPEGTFMTTAQWKTVTASAAAGTVEYQIGSGAWAEWTDEARDAFTGLAVGPQTISFRANDGGITSEPVMIERTVMSSYSVAKVNETGFLKNETVALDFTFDLSVDLNLDGSQIDITEQGIGKVYKGSLAAREGTTWRLDVTCRSIGAFDVSIQFNETGTPNVDTAAKPFSVNGALL